VKLVCRDVLYHVEIVGHGQPLLLLHGFTGNVDTWKGLIPSLSKHYQLIMVDLIGHGKTDSPLDVERYRMEQMASDLKSILEKLAISKADVLGYSMGGRLALTFANLYPQCVRSLLLESASPGLETELERSERRKQDQKLAERIVANGIEAFVASWENISLFESQKRLPLEQRLSIREQRLAHSPLGLANSLLGMGTGSQPSWWEELERLDVPVLLITGELDLKFCKIAERMQQRLKKSEWLIINDVGHAIHVEDGDKFGKIVSEFLMKHKEEEK
jgi:2-succinyl-6-hydroxy-2,4-cyclohexadiene-1-carboxylate synthase